MRSMRRRTSLALAAGGSLAVLVLAACGGGGTTSSSGGGTPTGTGTSAGAANVTANQGVTGIVNPSDHKGGTLRFAISSTPDSLDPGNEYYAWTLNFSRLYATPLLTYKSAPGAAGAEMAP